MVEDVPCAELSLRHWGCSDEQDRHCPCPPGNPCQVEDIDNETGELRPEKQGHRRGSCRVLRVWVFRREQLLSGPHFPSPRPTPGLVCSCGGRLLLTQSHCGPCTLLFLCLMPSLKLQKSRHLQTRAPQKHSQKEGMGR